MQHYYHLVNEADFKKFSDGKFYSPLSLDEEGFIHLSHKNQVEETYRRFYSEFDSLLLLEIKIQSNELDLRNDYVESEKTHFPHLYEKMPLNSIQKIFKVSFENNSFHYIIVC